VEIANEEMIIGVGKMNRITGRTGVRSFDKLRINCNAIVEG